MPLQFFIAAILCTAAALPDATPVFVAGAPKGLTYRIPALVRTSRGTLVAFAEARSGSDCDPKFIVSRRSTDGGSTWGPQQVVAGDSKSVTGNPTAVYDAVSQRIVLALVTGGCNPGVDTQVLDDGGSDGTAWGAPRSIPMGQYSGALPGPGTATQLPSGRLLFPAHYGAYVMDVLLFSDDHGASWTVGAPRFPLMDEAAVAWVPGSPQTLLIELRNNHLSPQKTVGLATSQDAGLTWTPISYSNPLLSPVCQSSLVGVEGAVYFSGPHSASSRTNITIFKSADGGVSWLSASFQAQEGTSDGYSCMAAGNATVAGHGSILMEGKGTISHALFPLDF